MKEENDNSFDNSNLDEKTMQKIQDEAKKARKKTVLMEKWRKQIESSQKAKEFFSKFKETSIDEFINNYLDKKYHAYDMRKFFSRQVKENQTKWIDNADCHLEPILQKKLFDLQCLWRANQIDLDGIEVCFDFVYWGMDIFNCPFVEITQDDIELYQDFLLSGELDNDWWTSEWQDYDEMKDDDERIPEWYQFHNSRTGNNFLSFLPDLRGDFEEFYRDLYFKDKNKDEPPREYNYDEKPHLFLYDEYYNFAMEVEDMKGKKLIENYHQFHTKSDRNEYFEEIVRAIGDIEEFIPIESHYNLKDAVIKAYFNYYFKKIAEHLPMAYEQYQFTRSMELGASKGDHDGFYKDLCKTFRKQILRGRYLNGESQDFNF